MASDPWKDTSFRSQFAETSLWGGDAVDICFFPKLTHTIHVWYIHLHLIDFYGKWYKYTSPMDPMDDTYYLFDPIGPHRSLCLGIWTFIQGVLCFRPTRLIETQRFRGAVCRMWVECHHSQPWSIMKIHNHLTGRMIDCTKKTSRTPKSKLAKTGF